MGLISDYEKFYEEAQRLMKQEGSLIKAQLEQIIQIYGEILHSRIIFYRWAVPPYFSRIRGDNDHILIIVEKYVAGFFQEDYMPIEKKLVDMHHADVYEYLLNKKLNGNNLLPVDFLNSLQITDKVL